MGTRCGTRYTLDMKCLFYWFSSHLLRKNCRYPHSFKLKNANHLRIDYGKERNRTCSADGSRCSLDGAGSKAGAPLNLVALQAHLRYLPVPLGVLPHMPQEATCVGLGPGEWNWRIASDENSTDDFLSPLRPVLQQHLKSTH